ncbi:MAG: hypothetical protein ACLSFZ_09235 [Frisingicoccus sp.]
MLSLLILSADVGYGLAREGLTLTAAGHQLRLGAIEAVFGALGFALFYSVMKVFLKETVREEPVEEASEENFIRCRLGDMASSFRKLSHMLTNEIPGRTLGGRGGTGFSELTENMCASCGRRTHCWEKNITIHATRPIICFIYFRTRTGGTKTGTGKFRRRCINIDGF